MARRANPNSAWSRMKRKAFEQGKREGYYEAFDKWFENRVTLAEKVQHGAYKGYRNTMAETLQSTVPASAPISGLRFRIGDHG